MHTIQSFARIFLVIGSLISVAHAQINIEPPNEKDVTAIIATHDDINSNLYQIIHITPGEKKGDDGFTSDHLIRVTAFGPESAGRQTRQLKSYLLEYSDEYGWYIEVAKEDSRGIFLEISSQKKGRVILR